MVVILVLSFGLSQAEQHKACTKCILTLKLVTTSKLVVCTDFKVCVDLKVCIVYKLQSWYQPLGLYLP